MNTRAPRARIVLDEARTLGIDLIAADASGAALPTLADYIDEIAVTFTAATYRPYWRLAADHLGKRRLAEITFVDLIGVVDAATQRAIRNRPASTGRASRETCVAALRAVFGRAHAAGLIATNPAMALTKPRRVRSRRRALDDRELAELIGAVRTTSLRSPGSRRGVTLRGKGVVHMFIQIIEGKTSDADGFRRVLEQRRPEAMKGAIGFLGATTAIAPDGTVVTMARFESAEQAAKNAARPEQTAFFEELTKYLAGAPTFHESTEVEEFLGGGSDDAGFVQFMIGTATDKTKAKASEKELTPTLESLRPDVLGGITAWDGDWWCQAIYFTSEAEARQGEKKFESMSANDRARFDEMMGAYGEPRFVDGPNPILV